MQVTDLYGGAITTVIPEGFLDACMIREVPDTQEVYVNSRKSGEFKDGLGLNESIIVDLLQRVDGVKTDKEALEVHVDEIATLNGASELHIEKYEEIDSKTQCCICVEDVLKWGKKDQKETVVVCTGLIRLKDVDTDVIITINVPVTHEIPHEVETLAKGILPERVTAAYGNLKQIVEQFRVVDDSLFV